MKQIIFGLGVLASLGAFSQVSEGGYPTTFKKLLVGEVRDTRIDYQVVELSKPNLTQIVAEDTDASQKGKPYRVSVLQPVSLNIQNSGTWKTLPNGDKIWRLGIKIPQAQALSLYFSEAVSIPEGGKLHAYNENHSQYVGAYTAQTPSFYSMEMIQGELMTLEYYLPYGSTQMPNISISNVAFYYRGVEDRIALFRESEAIYLKDHQSCEVDVACSEIAGWESQRDAVVHYSFVSGGSGYVCTASVINNTANDCTPYILTANHCGEPTSNANITNNTWYFNYQRPTCTPNNTVQYTGARSQTMSGGMLRASSQLGNQIATSPQVSGSDFTLIELNSTIPTSYNPYFAGWNRLNTSPSSGVGIHHPAGSEKKISTYTGFATSSTYNGGWSGAHWRVTWASTTNGHGVTEGGSSGSPLFNQDGLIVGHLSGGSSFCTSPTQPDLYGKMNKAWDQEGTNSNQQLKAWLDPLSTNATTLAGSYNPCSGGGGGSTAPCNATSSNCDEYIENVTLNTINNTSGCNNYSNFTSTSTTLTKGQSYTLNVGTAIIGSTNPAYTDDEIAAWIDWNNDGDFTDNGERIAYVLIASGASTSFNFTVPNTASSGNLNMRVRISFSPDDGPISPCGTSDWGEVEDYTVVIPGLNSIDENSLESVNIYPNPTKNNFTIDLEGIADQVESIEVTDLRGRQVTQLTNVTTNPVIELLNEPAGIYLVKLKSNFGNYTKKVVKF